MANQTIPGLPTISTPISAAMMWINDPSASPQDRSLALNKLISALGSNGVIGTRWAATLAAALGTNWPAILAAAGARTCTTTSGTLGALTVTTDYEYFLSGATTATLPANGTAVIGQKITFKAKTNATSTISAAAGQTIGTTSSTSFVLYAQEDYVTLEYDGTSVWYVVATNGPVLRVNQQQAFTMNTTANVWAPIANAYVISGVAGMTLGTLAPGVYDFEMHMVAGAIQSTSVFFGIGDGVGILRDDATTGIGSNGSTNITLSECYVSVNRYTLLTATTIQGWYNSTNTSQTVYLLSGKSMGYMTARRIG